MTKRKNQPQSNLWTEKYRPISISDCLLPNSYRATFEGFIARQEMPNLLLRGSTGIGKTSIAQALCNDMSRDSMIINATLEPNVDTIRDRVVKFASTRGFGGEKAAIFDEADFLNTQHTQPALSRCIEQFKQCRYLLTCNEPEKIIPRLKSRLMEFDFDFTDAENQQLRSNYIARSEWILDQEEIEFDSADRASAQGLPIKACSSLVSRPFGVPTR